MTKLQSTALVLVMLLACAPVAVSADGGANAAAPDVTWSYGSVDTSPDVSWGYANTPDVSWGYDNSPDVTWSYAPTSYPATVAYEPSYTYEPSSSYNPYGGYSNSYVNFSTGYPSYYSNPNYTYINSSYPTIPSYNSGYTYTYQSDYVYDYTVVRHDDDDNDHNDNDPSCELDASDRSVEEGDRITLTWDTEDADYASINQGIGRVDEDGGSERVRIEDNDDITFRMTVRNEDGEDTCSVTVRVDDDNENDFSNVTFYGEGTNNPPTVYLSSLPYTGLEDVAPQTYAYLLLLVAGIAWGGYMLYTRTRRIA